MAANETAALVVALSAQVSKFQKDMDAANGIANKAVKQIEDRFAAAGGVIGTKFNSAIQGTAAQLGTVGLAMSALGPVGLAVAAGIGALALAFSFVSDKTEIFAEKAKKLKDLSETVGLTATQLRVLFEAGKQAGVDSEDTERFLQRLAIAFEKLKTTGSGELFDALLKIRTGLVQDVASAKSLAEVIDIVAKAVHGLSDAGQKLELVGTISGKRNLSPIRLLDAIGGQEGGFKALQDGAEAAGRAVDTAVNDKIVTLKREIEDLKRKTDNVYGRMFAVETLEAQKRSAELWLSLAQNAERFAIAAKNSADNTEAGQRQATQFGRRFRGVDRPFVAGEQDQGGLSADQLIRLGQSRLAGASDAVGVGSIPLPTSRPEVTQKASAAVELELMKKWTSLLGEAITPAESLKLKILELNVAQEKGGVTDGVRARALAAFAIAQGAAALSARERLGVAKEEEITEQKLKELNVDRAKGFVKNAQEMATAEAIIAREAKASAEALEVRRSKTPELTRALIDAGNASKVFDQLATSSFNNAADAFADVVTGTKTLKDAFHDLVNSLTRDVARAAFKGLLAQLFGGAAGGAGGLFSGLFGGARAGGGGVSSGMAYQVGENGPELFVPNQSGTIVPNDVIRRGSSGSPQIFITNHVDATGADVAAISRLTVGLNQVNRSIEGRAVAALSTHRALRG